MAIPPEPIDELLPKAHSVVLAEVSQILKQGKQAALPEGEPGASDLPGELAKQRVELHLREVLRAHNSPF